MLEMVEYEDTEFEHLVELFKDVYFMSFNARLNRAGKSSEASSDDQDLLLEIVRQNRRTLIPVGSPGLTGGSP